MDVTEEAAEPAAKAPPPAKAAKPAPAPSDDALVIGYPPARDEPEFARPAPAPAAPAQAAAPIPSADVVPLEELDFGESPFAAPPRPAVQPAPEAEPVELPMLEAEEEIELTPAAEPTPSIAAASARLGMRPAREPLDSEVTAFAATSTLGVTGGVGKPAAAAPGEWTVAPAAPALIPATGARPAEPTPAPSDGGEAQLREALSRASREVIERIAWEVVPQLAETIIREQVDRLVKDRQR